MLREGEAEQSWCGLSQLARGAGRFRTSGSPGPLDETGDVPDLDRAWRSGRSSAGQRVSVPVILTLTTVVCKS
jgi:hypothetical protein